MQGSDHTCKMRSVFHLRVQLRPPLALPLFRPYAAGVRPTVDQKRLPSGRFKFLSAECISSRGDKAQTVR